MSVLGLLLGIGPRAESAPDEASVDAFDRPDLWNNWSGAVSTTSGEMVGPESSLSLSIYYACLKILAEDVAKVPWHLYRRKNDQGRTRASEDLRYWLVHDDPNSEIDDFTFKEAIVHWAAGWGAGYAEITRDSRGNPIGMHLIHPSRVTRRRNSAGALVYDVRRDSSALFMPLAGVKGPPEATLRDEDMFVLRNMGGYSVAELAAETIGHAKAVRRFGAAFFGHGTQLSGVLEHPGKISPQARNNLRQSWDDRYKGANNAFKTPVLEEGIKYHPLSVPPDQAQFVETIRATVPEVCNWFRMPMYKLNVLEGTPKANMEQLSLDYVGDTVQTWTTRLDKQARRKLLFEGERRTLYFEHDLNALMRADSAARSQFYKGMQEQGNLTINEVRARENMDGIGPAGDQHFVPLNMTTAERVQQGLPPPAGAQSTKPAAAGGIPDPVLKATARLFVAASERVHAKMAIAVGRKAKLRGEEFSSWVRGYAPGMASELAEACEPAVEAMIELGLGIDALSHSRPAAVAAAAAEAVRCMNSLAEDARPEDDQLAWSSRAADAAFAIQAASASVCRRDDEDEELCDV